jgi:predicted anti-sigma-YlaC factor YlaD
MRKIPETPQCRQLLFYLSDYIDGDLDQSLCGEIEQHLQGCRNCRIVVDTMKKTIELYQDTQEDAQMPDDVRRRLFARLNLEDYLNQE